MACRPYTTWPLRTQAATSPPEPQPHLPFSGCHHLSYSSLSHISLYLDTLSFLCKENLHSFFKCYLFWEAFPDLLIKASYFFI